VRGRKPHAALSADCGANTALVENHS
jgi:hypothetical protein